MTNRHPDRQTDRQNGITIRLTLCANVTQQFCENMMSSIKSKYITYRPIATP